MNKRTTKGEQADADEYSPFEQVGRPDKQKEESDRVHTDPPDEEDSLDDEVPRSPTPQEEFILPRDSNPEKYFTKMKRRLANIGVRYERLKKYTEEGQSPACFAAFKVGFDEWLSAASITSFIPSGVPYRYDMPGEPNYCHDCTIMFKRKAQLAGACRFPNVVFETRISNGEPEIVGVSRSPEIAPTGYRIFYGMLVDAAAVEGVDNEK